MSELEMSELEPGQVAAQPVIAEPIITDAQVEARQAVRVTVKKNERTGAIDINCSHPPIPSQQHVVLHLAPEYKKKIKPRSYASLVSVISESASIIPFQAWADAISSAIMTRLGNEQGATSELRHVTEGGYLALGTTLYKLSAVAQVPQMKALATARKKMRDVAELEAKGIMEGTRVSAAALIENAQKTRHEAQLLKQKAEQDLKAIPPSWLIETQYPIRYNRYSSRWEAQLIINFCITHFDIKFSSSGFTDRKYTWPAGPMDPRPIRLWVMLDVDGKYQATAIRVDNKDPEIPHINHGSGCMGLASGPTTITQARHLELLQIALEDCHRRVQLDSLYSDILQLMENFKQAFPKDLAAALKKNGVHGAVELARKLTSEVVNEEAEANTTWTA